MQELDFEALRDAFIRAGQGHIFRFWDRISGDEKNDFLKQLKRIDLAELESLLEVHILHPAASKARPRLEPAPIAALPKTSEELRARNEMSKTGEDALSAGKIAAFVVAGGQGTRLGSRAPKGLFPAGPVTGKSIFQMHAEKILALSRKYDAVIPWYIMTSPSNHSRTVDFFCEHDFFGLSKNDVMFFSQGMMPCVDRRGKLLLDAPNRLAMSPNGHGGSLYGLKDSGALDDMKSRGVSEIFYFQVDNVLIRICDPVFVGYHIDAHAEMSSKVVRKRSPEERVGIVCYEDGRLSVVEYSDLSREDMYAKNPDGSLKFWAGSIAIHVINVDFAEKIVADAEKLPFHKAEKKVPYIDENGNRIEPGEKNAVKFEMFVFDALKRAERSITLEVKREHEFAPVKDKKGHDTPERAKKMLSNMFGEWLEECGAEIPRDSNGNVEGAIEISPLTAMNAEELKGKIPKGVRFEGALSL